ncbi:hypothetical protein F4809DRAFT_610788 [Biscogniauxia mediterranea]|nr:hypothetical protein F4809DRAFT_610788 [Biscogniauxia mediterranea]
MVVSSDFLTSKSEELFGIQPFFWFCLYLTLGLFSGPGLLEHSQGELAIGREVGLMSHLGNLAAGLKNEPWKRTSTIGWATIQTSHRLFTRVRLSFATVLFYVIGWCFELIFLGFPIRKSFTLDDGLAEWDVREQKQEPNQLTAITVRATNKMIIIPMMITPTPCLSPSLFFLSPDVQEPEDC